ncbi:ferritin [Porphyromonas levii]|uniref:ferritin n=1 Tax=Porphyromonas levii TaxID=28114 RepID=UPI001BA4C8E4|nr:ferritin [Porphyromonas levii]MBR8704124.1 Bacterial non-heme ferritin [Porphyromonas levii]
MIKKELLKAINEQINFEYESAFIYRKMAIELETQAWTGFAHWFAAQFHEEMAHAEEMLRYVLERGERPELKDIKMNDVKLETLVDYFNLAYKHECKVSERINDIVAMAIEQKDYATENFFRKYVNEQVEEEATTSGILDRLKLVSSNAGYMIMDRELGARK